MPGESIESVLKRHTERLMALPGVVGVAQGEAGGKPCLKVLVASKSDDLLRQIPVNLEGYGVVVEETGEFQALGTG